MDGQTVGQNHRDIIISYDSIRSLLNVTGNGTIGQIINNLLLDKLLDVEYYKCKNAVYTQVNGEWHI